MGRRGILVRLLREAQRPARPGPQSTQPPIIRTLEDRFSGEQRLWRYANHSPLLNAEANKQIKHRTSTPPSSLKTCLATRLPSPSSNGNEMNTDSRNVRTLHKRNTKPTDPIKCTSKSWLDYRPALVRDCKTTKTGCASSPKSNFTSEAATHNVVRH